MTWYGYHEEQWTQQSGPGGGLSIQVRADDSVAPEIRFVDGGAEWFHLTGTDPRPGTDTTHTVARVDRATASGTPLFAVHADDNDLTFQDLRPPDGDAPDLAPVQSALTEILIPVYIDDVIRDLSESINGLVVLHTAQYAEAEPSTWTYFRTALFEADALLLEEEHGEL